MTGFVLGEGLAMSSGLYSGFSGLWHGGQGLIKAANSSPTPTPTPTPSPVYNPALIPPAISLAVPPLTYPPQLYADFQPGGDVPTYYVRLQSSATENFASILLDQSILIGTGNQNFPGLSSITSPAVTYFRERIQDATTGSYQYGDWSNKVLHGNATPATITSPSTIAFAELIVNPSGTLTANQTMQSWAVTGGTDAPTFTVDPATGIWTCNATLDYETKNSYSVTFTGYNLAGVATAQNFTLSVTDVDEIPDAFTFTPVTNATPSTVYTSNTITISGLGSGVSTPVSVTGGEYEKNSSGVWSTASTTASNTDTFRARGTSPAVSGSTTVSLNVGGVIGDYVISLTLATAEWTTTTGTSKNFYNNVSGTPPYTFTGTFGVGAPMIVRANASAVTATSVVRYTLNSTPASGEAYFFGFDNGADDLSGFGLPGSTTNAVCLDVRTDSWTIYYGGLVQNATVAAGFIVTGDVIVETRNLSTGSTKFERDRGGVITAIGTPVTTMVYTNSYAIGGSNTNLSATADFTGY